MAAFLGQQGVQVCKGCLDGQLNGKGLEKKIYKGFKDLETWCGFMMQKNQEN